MKKTLVLILLILVCCIRPLEAKTFKVASYNVENIFDLTNNGTEYTEYIPNTGYGWKESTFEIKIANIAEVIRDIGADVVALQEIESKIALVLLRDKLKAMNADYPYYEIADGKDTVVKCALLSKFPIIEKDEIQVDDEFARNILKVTIDIDGMRLTVFVNHWKSKRDPESMRLPYARALKKQIDKLEDDADFILIGDFNSDYHEWQSFRDSVRLNDTDGITGINHILKTVMGAQLVDESTLTKQSGNEYLYNLWLEVGSKRRWSHNFFGSKNSLDHIIVSKALYDDRGISYVDNSFDKFDPDYLFKESAVYRWQRAKGGKGKHLGEGYSDHLPIFASFSTEPFHFKAYHTYAKDVPELRLETKRISDLYTSRIGNVNYHLQSCVVIYKHEDNAIIKQKNGRAIFVYRAGRDLEYGKAYDLMVTELYDYHGLREITTIGNIKKVGQADNPAPYLLDNPSADFSAPDLQNEVISKDEGVYKGGYFYYGSGRKIKLYFTDNGLRPQNNSRIRLKQVRIGYHRYPQIVIEEYGQIEKSD
jgi:endonuclease/exonuclease/phosphatase family metal-dependent hydrolase